MNPWKIRIGIAATFAVLVAGGAYIAHRQLAEHPAAATTPPSCGRPGPADDRAPNAIGLLDRSQVWPDDAGATQSVGHSLIADARCSAKWFGVFEVDAAANCLSEWPWVPLADPYRDQVLAYHHAVDWRRVTMSGSEARDTFDEIIVTFSDPGTREDFLDYARSCDGTPVDGKWDLTTKRNWLVFTKAGDTRLVALAFGEFTRPVEDPVHRLLLDKAVEVAATAK